MFGNLKFIYDETPLWNERKVKDRKEIKAAAYVRFDQLYGDGKRKQIKMEQIQQESKLQQMLQEIELEESKQGITEMSKKLTASRKPGQFYEQNKQWAQKLKEKKQLQRTEQFNQAINQQFESQHQKSEQRTFLQETLLTNYTGPITGWQSRFENYLNTKIKLQEAGEQENTFKPKINETSKRMMQHRDRTPIEERLLKYGEELKMKQEIIRQQVDIINTENDEYGQKKPKINKNYIYGESDGSKIHDKLYDYAKVYDQKIQELKNQASTQFNFTPEINHIPQDLLEKVVMNLILIIKSSIKIYLKQQKRKPLYENKKKEQIEEKKPSKQFNVQNFEQFLERNYSQFERKLDRLQQRNEAVFEKEIEQCSFQPQINKKSVTQSSVEQEKSLYERELDKQAKKKETLNLMKKESEQLETKNCTFKPKKNYDIPQERKILQEQAKKEKEKKKNPTQINYPKLRCKTPLTSRNVQLQDTEDNQDQYSDNNLSNNNNSNNNHNNNNNISNSSCEQLNNAQKAFTNRHQYSVSQTNFGKSVNFQRNREQNGIQNEQKKYFNKQKSPLKRQSPSPKTIFKSNSSAKKGNELNQSKNDSESKNNQSFINNLLNSGLHKGNFNLESLLNQSIANWGDHYNLSPSKMSKKKILDEFDQIEKEIQNIVKDVDIIKEDSSNENVINSGNLPKSQFFRSAENDDSKNIHPQIIYEDHHNEQ